MQSYAMLILISDNIFDIVGCNQYQKYSAFGNCPFRTASGERLPEEPSLFIYRCYKTGSP